MKLSKIQLILLILAVGFIVYFNSLFNGFVWDDEEEIINNKIVQSLSNISYIWSGATFNTGGAGLSGWFFRPIRTLSIMVNYAIWGPHAFGWHLVQVSFHLINTILVFLILAKLLENSKFKLIIATILSLIFVVHPAISEGIVYIAASSEVMYSFCNLLAFWLLIESGSEIPKKTDLALFAVLLFVGMLVKESSIIIFPLMLCYLWIYKVSSWKRWAAILFLILAGYFFLRLVIIHTPIRAVQLSPISEATLFQRFLTLPLIVLSYLKVIFFPKDLAISQHFVVKSASFSQFFFPLTAVALFFGSLFYLSWRFRSKLIFFGLAWFILGMGPISNIFPLDMTIGERWLYFPLVGLIIVFASLLCLLVTRHRRFLPYLLIFTAFIIPILGGRTFIRNFDWHDGLTLYSHDVNISKDSFDIENNLGVELFRHGKIAEAKPHFQRSIDLNPKWHFAYNNLGAVYEREGNLEKAKELYQTTLRFSDYYLAYENLGFILLKTGKAKEAISFLEKAILKLPQNSRLRVALALAYYKEGNQKEAERYAQEAYFLEASGQNRALVETIMSKKKIDF